ncbi:MAG TPA: hypothetical protein VJB94_00575 [Candidatus Nanoarchaeia archaeon]|nr:hypothetical protein [Candidatus Nanoarchaeia archaeon]
MPIEVALDSKEKGLEFLLKSLKITDKELNLIGKIASLEGKNSFGRTFENVLMLGRRYNTNTVPISEELILKIKLEGNLYYFTPWNIEQSLKENDINELIFEHNYFDETVEGSAFGPQHIEHCGYWFKTRKEDNIKCKVLFYFF